MRKSGNRRHSPLLSTGTVIKSNRRSMNDKLSVILFVFDGGYVIMGGGGDATKIVERVDNVRNLSIEGKPDSRVDRYENGELIQQRWYDSKGFELRNRDYRHQDAHNNHTFPHDHIWDWSKKPPRLKDVEPDWRWK